MKKDLTILGRRSVLLAGGALTLAGLLPHRASAAGPIKMAGIYTVPVEQQWVSRIHQAAEAAKAAGAVEYVYTENVANTDYARVMREYCEQGMQLIVGEIFGAEQEARGTGSPRSLRRISRRGLPPGLVLPAGRGGESEPCGL